MSKAVAKVVAVRVLQHLDLPVKDSAIAFADDVKAKSATVAAMDVIIENEKMLRADYIGEGKGDDESKDGGDGESKDGGESKGGEESSKKKKPKVKRDEESLKRQIRMHYAVAKKLETTYNRYVAMAPLCDSRLPCIELCLKSVCDLYNYAVSQLKKKPDASEETKASDEQKKAMAMAMARANAMARAKARADAKPKRPLPKMTDAQVDRLKEPTLLTDILDQKLVRAMRARERDMLTMKPTHKGQSPLWVGHRHPTTPLA